MKKIIQLLIVTIMMSTSLFAQKKSPTAAISAVAVCCPEFKLEQDYKPPCNGNCPQDANGTAVGGGTPGGAMMASCRTTHSYTVVPNLIASGYTYTWTIIGGTPTSATGNPINITWAAASTNVQITVVISGPNGCNKTIKQNICLVDGPIANIITASPNPMCGGTPVNFSAANTSTMFYDWDFGDGTYGTGQNVTHTYAYSASTPCYNAILTVRGDTAKRGCGCFDRDTVQICVNNGTGLQITPVSCKKMFCPGDTATFCASNCAGPYTWTVVGGTPTTFTGNCIKVTWNATSLVPASVSVSSSNCPTGCGGSATLQVPVLFPNLQINGATTVCPGSTTNYSLPNMPGAFYKWTLSGGGFIVGADSNISNIAINWNSFPSPGGPYMLICNYHNPITGCKGADTINILVKPPFTINAFTIPCVGNPFNYSNSAIPTDPVAWTISPAHLPFPLTAPSISGTWVAANTYTILATPVNPGNYCTPSATVVVTVNPKPVVTAITPNTPVCKGSTQVYAAVSTLPGAGSFSWTVIGSTGTNVLLGAHNDSIQITWDPLAPSYSITVSQQVNGCYSLPFTQTIAFIPNPTIAPVTSTVCIDAVTTFTASGGTSYTWSINNSLGSLASPQGSNPMNVQWNGSFTPGTFPSIVTVANQCGNTASAAVNVITPNAFTITQSGDLCNPTGVLLTTSGGVSGYVWTGPSVSGSGSSVNALAPGLYTVTAIGTGGCPVKATITVLPKFLSAVSISSGSSKLWYCPGESINVVLSSSFSSSYTGCTYQWYQNGVSMGASYTSPTLTITSIGVFANNPGNNSFHVVVTCGGCTATSNAIPVLLLSACPPSTGSCPYASAKFVNRFDDNSLAINVRRAGGPSEQTFSLPPFGSVNITSPSNGATLCGGTATFTSTYSIAPGTVAVANAYWSFGDGTISSGTQTGSGLGPYNNTISHTYTRCGNYQVIMYVTVQCGTSPDTYCLMTDTINVVVPAVAKFNSTVVCNKVYLQDLSSVCSATCNFTYAWSAIGPVGSTFSFSPATTGAYSTIANTTVMTASMAGSYNITLTLTSASCGCVGPNAVVFSQNVVINLPSAAFTALSPVCAGTPISFTTTSVGTSYNWNFYSTYQSNLQTTVHSFPPPPPSSQLVTLTVKDANGCSATSSQTITVLPPITVNVTGVLEICPGDNTTLTATTAAVGPTYQWYHNGVMIGTNSSTYNATATGQYWVTVSSSSGGCFVISPKVTVKLKQAPIAKIKPISRICLGGGGANLQNVIADPLVNYNWSLLSGPPLVTVSFSPNGTPAAWQTTPTPSSATAGDYIFVLEAIHTVSLCKKYDTICIKVYNKPVFTVSGAPGCEGVNNTFTALPAITYNYLWSNGASGNIMTTSIAGLYDVMATDPISGCISVQYAVALVKPKPNVSLFPLSGCDTLCNSDTLVPPLPLITGQTYAGVYNIQWYDGVTLIYTGPYLVLNTLTPNPGQHNIHIVVNFIGSTCISTSGNYNVYIKNCDSCNCEQSSWGEISWTFGNNNNTKKPTTKKSNVPGSNGTIINCGASLGIIDCNNPITVNSSYNCVGANCVGLVQYSLSGPVTQNGAVPFSTAGLPAGSYVLTLYGICGTDTCKRCEFPFTIVCQKNCCEGSVWEEQPWYSFDKNGKKKEKINCTEQEQVIVISGDLCKQPLTFGGTIKCPTDCKSIDSVFIYDGGNVLIQSGVAPYTMTVLPNGSYTVEVVGYCGGQPCLKCKIILKVDCEKCDCDSKVPLQLNVTINEKVKQIECNTDLGKIDCKKNIIINGTYTCNPKDCPANLSYSITGPAGYSASGSLPLTINPSLLANGNYTIIIMAYCGGKLCKECKITFTVDCEMPCCPYAITVTPKVPTYTAGTGSTIVSNNYTITIPTTANITEVRVNVVSYTIDDDFKGDCLKCVNLPFTWASVSTATNINTAAPKITMYGGASVPSFNGSGAGAYQNPREVIWNNGSNLNVSPYITNIGMGFILPPTPAIDCCKLKGKICVKFTFRDNDCKECEVIACFYFEIKK
jgi:PKD domain/PKD-like domain